MTKEVFTELIENAQKFDKELERWYDFGIELDNLPIAELSWNFFNITLPELFTDEGVDWINWWLFDRVSIIDGTSHEVKDKDGSIIPTDTIDDLWELVKNCQK